MPIVPALQPFYLTTTRSPEITPTILHLNFVDKNTLSLTLSLTLTLKNNVNRHFLRDLLET